MHVNVLNIYIYINNNKSILIVIEIKYTTNQATHLMKTFINNDTI